MLVFTIKELLRHVSILEELLRHVRVHEDSDTHHSQPRSQPVNRAPAPLQTGFEPTFPPTAKRPPFCQFD